MFCTGKNDFSLVNYWSLRAQWQGRLLFSLSACKELHLELCQVMFGLWHQGRFPRKSLFELNALASSVFLYTALPSSCEGAKFENFGKMSLLHDFRRMSIASVILNQSE